MAKSVIALSGSDWICKDYIGEDWLFRGAVKADTRDVRGWRKATVPGSVQNDLWQAGAIPDPYFEMNSLAIEWVPERTWLYKKTFPVPADLQGQRVRLVFEGVDYAARYYLNGEQIGASTGTYIPAAFDVSDALSFGSDNHLAVVIDPAPFEQPQIGYTSKVYTQKARMNYWWDFCPRMIHLGIWQDVYLEVTGPQRIEDAHVTTELAFDHSSADVTVAVNIEGQSSSPQSGTQVEVSIFPEHKPEQKQMVTVLAEAGTAEAAFTIENPALWWPNGAGKQRLYRAVIRVATEGELTDTREVVFGIRTVEFEQNKDAAPESLPYLLTVNGRKLFINGWNWVPMDVLYGVEQPEKRERLLRLAQNAGVNMLRVWGGGLIEKQQFYDLCDRLGILVWQEFIQSSSGIDNYPSEDPAFISFLVENARHAIVGRRNHPSLAVWCGGNELHYAQDRLVDDSHPALAALRDVVRELDPARHWVPSSPAGGMFGFGIPENEEDAAKKQDVHGPWEYQGLRKHYHLYNNATSLLHSEFGVEGLTNLRALNATISPERQWPVSLENPVWHHLGAWWVKEKVWKEAFGDFDNIEEAQKATQFLQADGLRYAIEADRRRQFHTSGTLPWQFNEPYPMAGCTSAVDYFAEPKPVYYTVKRAYQPLTVTAKFDSLIWDEPFHAEIWCSNSGAAHEADLQMRVLDAAGETLSVNTIRVTLPSNGSEKIWEITQLLDELEGEIFFLSLDLYDRNGGGALLAQNWYVFTTAVDLSPLLRYPETRLDAEVQKAGDRWTATIRNSGGKTALWVWLESEKPDLRAPGYAYFSDNYFCLFSGESREIEVEWSGVPEDHRAITAKSWNSEQIRTA